MSFMKDGRWCMCVLDKKPHIFWVEDAMGFLDGLTPEGAQKLVEVHNKSLRREHEIHAEHTGENGHIYFEEASHAPDSD